MKLSLFLILLKYTEILYNSCEWIIIINVLLIIGIADTCGIIKYIKICDN